MTIEVLVCRPDGSQAVEQREVSENWFSAPPEKPEDTTNK